MVAWEVMPRILSRTSFWKPFITESTVINATTPNMMPSSDVSEINDMKWLRRLARV